ncbi:ABC transporter permease [Anaerococcus sp. AGMB00486]|uniref:ABC transporter permease n=1 Tax=Anaerococcus faecalis TaxID=2742993 RepID=A0ABX2N7U1_9FIRM|nr:MULTISPECIES: ABC transporter permease [Anaerococcus]MDY3006840.1 ABC transporter permease [Anaerococcus porci]NVF10762.1 ABC transporter permease [Anaerococcus faecalis]
METTKTLKASRSSSFKSFWYRFKKNKLAVVGLIILLLLVLIAIFADFVAPYSYDVQDISNAFATNTREHILGTDNFGRDIFSRIVYGARISLTVGIISVGIATILGGFLGAIAGYYGGRIDNFIMRITDILLSIPQLLLAIAIAAALGTGVRNLMIAVGLSSIPTYARIMRSSVISAREQEYVEAAKLSGASDFRIIFRHVLPNCIAPIIVQMTLGIASAILNAASLSFIGLGVEIPAPEWGAMLSEGRQYIRYAPFLTLYPGIVISITIFALNIVGDGLRDALDPKQKR